MLILNRYWVLTLALAGSAASADTITARSQPPKIRPEWFASVSSVINRIKCDALTEMSRRVTPEWQPDKMTGTIGLELTRERSGSVEAGFEIPVIGISLEGGGSDTDSRTETRSIEIGFELDFTDKLPPICAGKGPAIDLRNKDGARLTQALPDDPLIDFVDMKQVLSGVAYANPVLHLSTATYSGGFAFKNESEATGGLNLIIVKFGGSKGRSSAYEQSYSLEITYKPKGQGPTASPI